jgi:redox-sensitive bicupin YhaK (pirin superfamily)
MSTRTVQQITVATQVQMGRDFIYQPFPSHQLRNVDPFILLHHWGPYEFPPNNDALALGGHPHRGFEPVTFIFKGEVWHRDTMGNDSIIKEGGVQWMTAGKGVMHSEMGTDEFHKKGGAFEIIQVWMNLPKKLKMTEPVYQGFQKNDIPVVTEDGGKVKIAVVSGKVGNTNGPIKSITGISAYTIYMEANSKTTISSNASKNAMLYMLDGSATVNGKKVEVGRSAITFDNDGTDITIEATQQSKFLFLEGEALKEPVAQYGPFVMNTTEELHQAFEDFQSGKMGILED